MARETNAFLIPLLFLLTLAACSRDREALVCKPTLEQLAPTASSKYKVNAGQVTKFHAECEACEEGQNFGVRWMLNGEVAGYSNDYVFVACNEDAGIHKLSAQAITYATTETASVEKVVAAHTWNITVTSISKPTPPSCYAPSLDDIRNTSSADDPAEQKKLQAAVSCLDEYLAGYACDFQASYGSGLAKTALFLESFYPLYQRRQSLTQEDVQEIVSTKVEPIRQNFLVVEQKAPADFSFRVNGAFLIYAFKDDPNLEGNDTIRVFATGRHDKGEALLAMSVMNLFDAGLSIGLANIDSIEFMLHTPDNSTPVSFSDRLISLLESNPRFLSFADGVDEAGNPANVGQGLEGQRLIGISQNSFIQALQQVSDMLDWVRNETHDQIDDPIRYWDCGKDGICPNACPYMETTYFNFTREPDKAEYSGYPSCKDAGDNYEDRNLNQACDEAWTKKDAGECNGIYDEGEAFGTERIAGSGAPERNGPPVAIDKWQKILTLIRENIRGPNHLDLDKIGEIAVDAPPKFVSGTLRGFGIPFPMVRMSEFFLTPTSVRDLLPLYDKKAKQFIIDLESEPFLDYGYDWLASEDENGYHVTTKRDPNFDDFDPYCNPDCNENDRLPNGTKDGTGAQIDNDGDGIYNGNDQKWGFTKDFGTEGNFVFDFIDLPQGSADPNGLHDIGEPSEKFVDEGTLNASGRVIGKGDGKWTKSDKVHPWPSGSNIGPVSDLLREPDVSNGTTTEIGGLYDNYYFFFQDPTISDAVHFVVDPYDLSNDLKSANGVSMSDNARLMRFFSKVIETLTSFELREPNAHKCLVGVANCNHWSNTDSSRGYQ